MQVPRGPHSHPWVEEVPFAGESYWTLPCPSGPPWLCPRPRLWGRLEGSWQQVPRAQEAAAQDPASGVLSPRPLNAGSARLS